MLLLELMPKQVSIGRPAPSGGEPGPKKPRTARKPSKEEKNRDGKVEKAEYVINGGNVLRPYREFGYSNVHGGIIPTHLIAVENSK